MDEVNGFVASPVREPASLLALLFGSSILAYRRRKKTA
ncbi:MAG: PEP-CTERM sorting domain-containing protein [Armatimonadetes bacterium]|nr:PEP-CTERM sorting domain-containing protein [Armatimonadota bacterium]